MCMQHIMCKMYPHTVIMQPCVVSESNNMTENRGFILLLGNLMHKNERGCGKEVGGDTQTNVELHLENRRT